MSAAPEAWSVERCEVVLSEVEEPSILLSLQAVQGEFGHVPDKAVPLVARACNASRADVFGVLTFYRDLRQAPPPLQQVRVCMGEACQAVGARSLREDVRLLAGDTCEVTDVFCLGNCALGPSAVVDGRLLGRATAAVVARAVANGS